MTDRQPTVIINLAIQSSFAPNTPKRTNDGIERTSEADPEDAAAEARPDCDKNHSAQQSDWASTEVGTKSAFFIAMKIMFRRGPSFKRHRG